MEKNKFPIEGFIPITLLDWSGKISSMVFLGSCNLRCPFCYNADLVLRPDKLKTISEKEIYNFLDKKKKWIDGMVIGGGEPTLYPEGLYKFCQKMKQKGLLVQIQTNGTNPEILKKLIEHKLVDYIAMDIKGPLDKYEKIVKVKLDKEKIQKSVDLIAKSKIESEFRTTVVPELLDEVDIEQVGQWLGKLNIPYYLQQFRNEETLEPAFVKIKPYSKEKLEKILKIAQKYFKETKLRGI